MRAASRNSSALRCDAVDALTDKDVQAHLRVLRLWWRRD